MIEIINYKPQTSGALKASFTVNLPKIGMEIRELGLFESQGKKWINLPSKPYEKDGQKKYFPLVQMTPDAKTRFDKQVFEALDKLLADQGACVTDEDDLPF